MADAKRDNNRVTSLLGVSNVDNSTPVILWADPVTHALLISGTISVDTTGLATETKQDTIIGHLDGVEGLLTTIDTDTGNIATSTSSIDSKTPTLGQALAASSVPVVLTAAQLTTLTPPAAITGFATSANQTTIIGHLDGVETLLGTIDADTGTIATEVAGLLTNTELRATPVPVSLTSTTVTGTVAVTQSGTWDEVGINDSGNSITVDYATTGSGTATGALRVELPNNGTGVIATVGAVTAITNALPAGTNAIGKLAANSGVDIGDVDVTSISAGTNLVGDVGIQPRTTNGLDTFMASGSDGSSILVATAQAVKAAAGKVYGYYLYNPEAAVTFVHFYNIAAASVTVGTTSPLFTLAVPAGSAANLGITDMGVTFGTAISISATTTAGGNTAPTTGVSAVIWFK